MAISSLHVVARLNGYFLAGLFPRCLAVGGQDPPLATTCSEDMLGRQFQIPFSGGSQP